MKGNELWYFYYLKNSGTLITISNSTNFNKNVLHDYSSDKLRLNKIFKNLIHLFILKATFRNQKDLLFIRPNPQ